MSVFILTKPSSLDILPACKAPVIDSNGATKEMIVMLFLSSQTPAWEKAVSEMKPPLIIDLANATTPKPDETAEVAFGIPFEASVEAIVHLPNKRITLHSSIQTITGHTDVFKGEVCGRQCSTCKQSLSPGQNVNFHFMSKLATHTHCGGEHQAGDPNNPCSPGYLVEFESKLYCFCMMTEIDE